MTNGGDDGSAELVLDIDYILECIKRDATFEFVVSQATLQFHRVFGLRMALDYVAPSAGMGAFSLRGIERERTTYPEGNTSYKWLLDIHWPSGYLQFLSPGFTQRLVGPRYTQSAQSLDPARRQFPRSP